MFEGVVGIALNFGHSGCQDDHIAALFEGHIATIGLTVGFGIGTHIVGCKIFLPATALAVLVDEVHKGFGQLGIVVEEEGRRGVGDIYGANRAVRETLLREQCKVALRGFDKFVGSNGLAVGQSAHLGILATTCLDSLGHHLAVELVAFLHQLGVVVGCQSKLLANGTLAATIPIGAHILAEILNRENIIVANHNVVADLFLVNGAERACNGHLATVVGGSNLSALGKCFAERESVANGVGRCSLVGCHIEVTPVDTHIVALTFEDGLLDGATLNVVEALVAEDFACGLLCRGILCPMNVGLEVDLYLVVGTIVGANCVGDVVHGPRNEFEVVGQQRSRESQAQIYGTASEVVGGAGGLNIYRGLSGSLGHRNYIKSLFVEAKIDQTTACAVVAVGCDGYFATRLGNHLGRNLDALILFPNIVGGNHLLAIEVEFKDVVVRVVEVEAVALQILGSDLHLAAYPHIFGVPGGLYGRVVYGCAEWCGAYLPATSVEAGLGPAFRGLGEGVGGAPIAVLSCGGNGGEDALLGTHKAVHLAIYTQSTHQREGFAGPVLHRAVVELVGGRPRRGVGVDGDERVGGCSQFVPDGLGIGAARCGNHKCTQSNDSADKVHIRFGFYWVLHFYKGINFCENW